MGLAWTISGAGAALLGAFGLSGVASAADGDAATPFRVGLVAHDGEGPAIEGLSAIKAAFSSALSMPVEVLVARDYAALIESHLDGRIDYAVYTAPAYAAASIRCACMRPVAAPIGIDGSFGLRSVLIVRGSAGGDAPTAIAVGPDDSLATRLAPMAFWPGAANALGAGGLVPTGTAGEAEAMFMDGAVDAYFGWVPARPGGEDEPLSGGSIERLAAAGVDASGFDIEWRSVLLRYGPHAVRDTLPQAQVEALQRLLSGVVADPDLNYYLERRHGGGFAAATQQDYLPVIEALGAVGQVIPDRAAAASTTD